MLLLSTASTFCGDSSCTLLWSDLFKSSVHLSDVELDAEVPVSANFFFCQSMKAKRYRCHSLITPFCLPPTRCCHLQVFAALADNAKHNQTGHTDEYRALRHRKVELCPIRALTFLFYAYFHILACPVPNFEPNFTVPRFGEYGQREWYEYHVFHTVSVKSGMTYESEHPIHFV